MYQCGGMTNMVVINSYTRRPLEFYWFQFSGVLSSEKSIRALKIINIYSQQKSKCSYLNLNVQYQSELDESLALEKVLDGMNLPKPTEAKRNEFKLIQPDYKCNYSQSTWL